VQEGPTDSGKAVYDDLRVFGLPLLVKRQQLHQEQCETRIVEKECDLQAYGYCEAKGGGQTLQRNNQRCSIVVNQLISQAIHDE